MVGETQKILGIGDAFGETFVELEYLLVHDRLDEINASLLD